MKRARVTSKSQYFILFQQSMIKCRIFSAMATKFRTGSDAAGRNVESTQQRQLCSWQWQNNR